MTKKGKTGLADLLAIAEIKKLTGEKTFEKGEDYFHSGQVASLVEHENVITAKVIGRNQYHVKFWLNKDALRHSCSCPMGQQGNFCKHCVAVALAWEDDAIAVSSGREASGIKMPMKGVCAYVNSLSKEALVKLLIKQALEDESFLEALSLEAATRHEAEIDVSTFQAAIDRATSTHGFVDYREMYSFCSGVKKVLDSVRRLLKEAHFHETIEITEYFLKAVEDTMNEVDDSDGELGDILDELQEIHCEACEKARPDSEALAKMLFSWETSTEWDTFSGAAQKYSKILGKKGLAVYRALAEKEWTKMPEIKPGQDDSSRFGRRFRISHIMEDLAKASGDIEALVAIKAKDLSNPYQYFLIAQEYVQAKKPEKAIEWAEKGIAAFPPEKGDSRLRSLLADVYEKQRRFEEAMKLIWENFCQEKNLVQYQDLRKHAVLFKDWPKWQEQALKKIRDQLEKNQEKPGSPSSSWGAWRNQDNSLLVEIALFEKDPEWAWQEAKKGGCRKELWINLAETRKAEHPQDALEIYQKQVDPTVMQGNNDAYKQATRYVKIIGEIMNKCGRARDFTSYLDGVRKTHKLKRNFLRELEKI